MFESLLDSVAYMLCVARPSLSSSVVIELDKTGMVVSSGPFPLQSTEKNSTLLAKFQGKDFYMGGEMKRPRL